MTIDWHNIVDGESSTPAIDAPLKEKATLVGRIGFMMLSVGTGAWRVRASMNKIARGLNITCNADIGLLSIEYTCVDGSETFTNAISLSNTGINTHRLSEIEDFADNFADTAKKYSTEQIHMILDKFQSMPGNYNAWKLGLASGAACYAFTFLLGGGIIEMIGALFGAGVGNFVRKKLLERHITLLANVAVGVAAACTVYVAFIKLAELLFGVPAFHQAGYICSMLFIIPGFPLITGGIDLAKLDLRSGLERTTYALLIILTATATGWATAMIYRFSPGDFEPLSLDPVLHGVFIAMASFVGVFGFSLMFNSPVKMAATAGLIGVVANTLRLELIEITGLPAGAAAFIGALSSGLLASAMKRKVGFPRITLTVPSIVIMVPGMYMYKGVYFMAMNDITMAATWFTKAILIVVSLPLGLIFARIFTDNNFRKSS